MISIANRLHQKYSFDMVDRYFGTIIVDYPDLLDIFRENKELISRVEELEAEIKVFQDHMYLHTGQIPND